MLIGDYTTLCLKALGHCHCSRCEATRKAQHHRQQKMSLVLDYVKACYNEKKFSPQLTVEQAEGIELILGNNSKLHA